MNRQIFINICGGTGSGKTVFAEQVRETLTNRGYRVLIISLDGFYKDLNEEQLILVQNEDYNFDDPQSMDKNLMINTLVPLKKGEILTDGLPGYSFINHRRIKTPIHESINPKDYDFVIIESIFSLYFDEIVNISDVKVFIDVEADIRLGRRMIRDVKYRGRTGESVFNQYEKFVKKSHQEFIEPTKQKADVIVPRGGYNKNALEMVTNFAITQISKN